MFNRIFFIASLAVASVSAPVGNAAEWTIPLGGNIYRLSPKPSDTGIRRDGTVQIEDTKSPYAAYFYANKPASLQLGLVAKSLGEPVDLELSILGKKYKVAVNSSDLKEFKVAKIDVKKAAYIKVEIRKLNDSAKGIVETPSLVVRSQDDKLELNFVENNEGGMYYWGRRGPSVHLSYQVPKDMDLQFAYSEINVPKQSDVQGSYFMANGFAQGYFGFQVNSDTERRVLFSVWSPFSTDNPKDIPEDQRIVKLASGKDVHVGEFGNEGSGGQSYLRYPWVAGRTYRFLTEVKPDGDSHTIYTSWFGDKEKNEWRLIASFRRPMTSTYLQGFHSFLENFTPTTGHIPRGAYYGNQWVRDVQGNWIECTQAKLTADNTGRKKQRIDYGGGEAGKVFFMRNCGFENTNGQLDKIYERTPTQNQKPKIDVAALPTK